MVTVRESIRIAGDLALALDPVRLAERSGIAPDRWQADVLRSTAPRVLLNCSRQSGKSTVTALLALHAALYEPGALILVLAPAQRQSVELYRKLRAAYGALGAAAPPSAESALRLELGNGSRIVALPGKEQTVRGFSGVRLLIVDEAARVPSDLYFALRPMLAVSGGRLVALSTPFGRRGWWADAWHSSERWERVEVPAAMCPRISPAFLEEERRTLGAWWFEQEFECKFLDGRTQVFSSAEVEAAFAESVETWAL